MRRRTVTQRALCLPNGKAVYTGTEETKKPNGEGKQVSHGKDVKVREMRTAETILNKQGDWRAVCRESGKHGSEAGWEKRPQGPRS
jgi:hypothetical protein